ncbi:MAG: hypothetical protein KC419_01915 [Anaerolineales bacterium]|nr:hypothetical protein [Anaerolineales bacterium]
MSDFTGLILGFVLTLLIFSYLFGDNPLYRLAVHLLVGSSAAFAAVVVVRQVIVPVFSQIQQDPGNPNNLLWFVPTFFALLLLLKWLPNIGWLGNHSLALLIGVGAATALVGVITGTLWPQITAVSPADALFPGQGIVVAVLTACTLLAFQFTGRSNQQGEWTQPGWQRTLAVLGRVMITITFGVLFAAVLNTSIILLSDRVGFFLNEFLLRLS